MASFKAQHVPSGEAAEAAVVRLTEMSPDLRGCAVLDPEGRALAASGDPDGWSSAGAALLTAADAAADDPAGHVHVATEDGEAFAVRHGTRHAIAVSSGTAA